MRGGRPLAEVQAYWDKQEPTQATSCSDDEAESHIGYQVRYHGGETGQEDTTAPCESKEADTSQCSHDGRRHAGDSPRGESPRVSPDPTAGAGGRESHIGYQTGYREGEAETVDYTAPGESTGGDTGQRSHDGRRHAGDSPSGASPRESPGSMAGAGGRNEPGRGSVTTEATSDGGVQEAPAESAEQEDYTAPGESTGADTSQRSHDGRRHAGDSPDFK